MRRDAGYEEIAHTADWALHVWAPSLDELFVQSAEGMTSLLEMELADEPRENQLIELEADDIEGLLVDFLSELVYLIESGLGFERFAVRLDGLCLEAQVSSAALLSQRKEIKAVTYHKLVVEQGEEGFEATIVFDV